MKSIKHVWFCPTRLTGGLNTSMERKTIENSTSSTTIELIRPLFRIILYLIFLNFMIILQDFYSSFDCIVNILKSMFSGIWNTWSVSASATTNENVNSSHEIRNGNHGLLEVKELIMEGNNLSDEKMGKVASVFDEEEPSLEEVKEAFNVFDENKDGFIDAKELRNVLSFLCLVEASEEECRRMIKTFDLNLDGRIDLCEFVKVIETSLC